MARARWIGRVSGRAACSASRRLDLLTAEGREEAEERARLGVRRIDEELVERVGRGPGRVEPDGGPGRRLAELASLGVEQQRIAQGVGPLFLDPGLGSVQAGVAPADQLETGRDVAPLIGAAHLELDAERPVEVLEVGRLEEHVAELGERQAAGEALADRIPWPACTAR